MDFKHITEKYLVREYGLPLGTYLITKNPKHCIATLRKVSDEPVLE